MSGTLTKNVPLASQQSFNPLAQSTVPEWLRTSLSSSLGEPDKGSIFGAIAQSSALLQTYLASQNTAQTAQAIADLQREKNELVESLFKEALAGIDEFRAIAARRFDVLGGLVKQRGEDVLESNRNFGREERRRVDDAFTQANAADESSLAARGLGGTTVGSSLRNRNMELARRAHMDISDRTANRETGLRLETGRDLERFIMARTAFQGSLMNERNRILEARTVAFDPSAAIAALSAGGQQTSAGQNKLALLGGLAGTAIGAAFGGVGGASIGASLGSGVGTLAAGGR